MKMRRLEAATRIAGLFRRSAQASTARRMRLLALVLIPLVIGFVWGFFAHRQRLFPFAWLHRAAVDVGALKGSKDVEWRAAPERVQSLVALPYLTGTVDPDAAVTGVLINDSKRAMPGRTLLITKRHGIHFAILTDLDGRSAWSWRLPGVVEPQVATLLADGDLLVVDQGNAVVRLDRSGHERWRLPGDFHHALTLLGDRVVTLRKDRRVEPRIHRQAKVVDDEIVTIDLSGKELQSWSILEAILASPYAFLVSSPSDDELNQISTGRSLAELELDVLHTNHVAPTGVGAAGVEPLAAAGNWLISVRNLNLLAVVDGQTGRVSWAWGPGRLVAQHHPTLLPSGHILVFNNGRDRSEVLEVAPAMRRVVWRYADDGFFSSFAGSCQRLANGNTLITESMTGYVFEVTPQGERVWVWANPDIAPDATRSSVYRATRHGLEDLSWLPEPAGALHETPSSAPGEAIDREMPGGTANGG